MEKVVIVSALRTPIGSFQGVFKDFDAVQLGVIVTRGVLEKVNLQPTLVDEVIFGNVLSSGLGQNVARQIAVHAGISESTPSFTVNKVCGSGLKAVELAVQAIQTGNAEIVIAGGTENMSRAPHILNNHRSGQKLGDITLVDTLLKDGLTDAFEGIHMGITAENIVDKYGFTREQLDNFALESQLKAGKAVSNNLFKDEIIPVVIKGKKDRNIIVESDEYPRNDTSLESLSRLRPAFKKDGAVTAGNASGINDGAAAVLLMSEKKAIELGIPYIARFVTSASSGVSPSMMGTGPIPSTLKALKKANWNVSDLDLIEANEAFASQSLSVIQDLQLDPNKVNVNGGAIALGHPIGASGTRILVTLVHEMQRRNAKRGMATLCVGGGQGITMLIER